MSRRVRHHVNPLGSAYLAQSRALPSLPAEGAMEVELGCADARFLFERAPQHPAIYFVGLEIREPLVELVNRQAREARLPNLLAVFSNIHVDVDLLFSEGRIDRVFVNFPDPWFKRRHQKRRLVNTELVELLYRKLRPGGELFFQSDVFDLALDAMAVVEASPELFANTEGPWSFLRDNPHGAKSLREVRCEERGLRIWRMRYLRR